MNPGCYPDLMQKSLLAGSILTSAIEWIQCLPHGCSGDKSFSSVAQSRLTLCNSMGCSTPGFPLLSPSPRAYSNSCPLGQWCHPTISSSVVLFPSRLQSFPASGSFPMSRFFPSDGQSIGVSAFSISPSNEYSRLISFRMDWLDLLAVQGTLKSLFQHYSSKASIL